MFGRAFTVGAVRGIDIKVDVSWIFIALLITWNFWARFTTAADEHASGIAVVMAIVASVLFFGSILVHELAHALEAQHRGVTVVGITLFIFGGATESRFDVRRPVDEFALTAVGPFSSFVLAAAFGLVTAAAQEAGLEGIADVTGLLAWINLALGVFNLLPGAPLDGGRVLRSIVWWVTDDRRRATRVAGRSGQVLGVLLIALGVWQFLALAEGGVGGLWTALIGWFLLQAARAELAQVDVEELLEGRDVGTLLQHDAAISLPAELTVDDAVNSFFSRREADAFIVVDEIQGAPVGVLTVDAVRRVPRAQRRRTRVREVMAPFDDVQQLDADSPATEAFEPVQRDGVVIVRRDGAIVGVLTAMQVARVLQRLTWLEGRRAGTGS